MFVIFILVGKDYLLTHSGFILNKLYPLPIGWKGIILRQYIY